MGRELQPPTPQLSAQTNWLFNQGILDEDESMDWIRLYIYVCMSWCSEWECEPGPTSEHSVKDLHRPDRQWRSWYIRPTSQLSAQTNWLFNQGILDEDESMDWIRLYIYVCMSWCSEWECEPGPTSEHSVKDLHRPDRQWRSWYIRPTSLLTYLTAYVAQNKTDTGYRLKLFYYLFNS